ncbi:IS91 family transposase, partial [Planctomycetota bacterium]
SLAKARWLEARKAELLPVPYFHVVFTIPHIFNSLVLRNKRTLYSILFQAVSETLREVAANSKNLGAEIGFIAVLHTWSQNLSLHPHLHVVVPGGGLSPDRKRWMTCREGFFLPVRVLSAVFRGKFLSHLEKAFHSGRLEFSGKIEHLVEAAEFKQLLQQACAVPWVVYAKKPFAGPQQVFEYLGRYTHRVALSNNRLVKMENNKVTFRWKDYADGSAVKNMTLDAAEFIRRFLLHVLPKGFVRIRHFGFLSNRNRKTSILLCRKLLGEFDEAVDPGDCNQIDTWQELLLHLTVFDATVCPNCQKGHLIEMETLLPEKKYFNFFEPIDSS